MLNGGTTKWIEPKNMSAVSYLKGTSHAAEAAYLYVLRVARSCYGVDGEPCIELADCIGCPDNCKAECRTANAGDLFLGVRGIPGAGDRYRPVVR